MKSIIRQSSHVRRQHGLTLIELMVAMTLSLLLLAGVIQVFISSKTTYQMQDGLSRLQENARFALSFLARDIRGAGFWGCVPNPENVTNHINGGGGYDIGTGSILGTDGAAGAPDTITLQGAYSNGLTLQSPYGPQTSSNVAVPSPNSLQQGDIVILSDCTRGDVFQVSNMTPSSGVIVHNTGVATSPGNAANPGGCAGTGATPHCLSKVYKGDAELLTAQSFTYSIAAGNLQRTRLAAGALVAEPLVDGIENMQVLYGIDTNGNGEANRYMNATAINGLAAANGWPRVVSAKIALLVRSPDGSRADTDTSTYDLLDVAAFDPADDRRLRRVFTITVTLRNRAP